MKGADYLVESESISWLTTWQESYEKQYDRNILRLLIKMVVMVGMLVALHWAGASGYGVVSVLAIATFLCCYSSVNMFFDDFFCNGLFREETDHVSSFSLAMVLAAVTPAVLWW
ncbi:hypothetical protein MRB56_14945 [Halomonas cupida]|nr:hypothetical protein [Halomonas cupida]